MKKSTKIILIVAAAMLVGGGLLAFLSARFGGAGQLEKMIMAKELDFDIPGTDDVELKIDMHGIRITTEDEDDNSAIAIYDSPEVPEVPEVSDSAENPEKPEKTEKPENLEKPDVAEKNDAGQSSKEIASAENIREIEMELGAGEITVKKSPDDRLYIQEEGDWHLKSRMDGGKLTLSANIDFVLDFFTDGENVINAGKAVVYLPEKTYDSIDIEMGAGVVTMGELVADSVSITVGAGEMSIESITADELKMEVAAGSCNIESMAVRELDADIAMGKFDGKGTVEQELNAQVGMGEITLKLTGKEADYDYSVDCGAGEVRIGNWGYEGIAGEEKKDNPGNKEIDVDCGMGSVDIRFEE